MVKLKDRRKEKRGFGGIRPQLSRYKESSSLLEAQCAFDLKISGFEEVQDLQLIGTAGETDSQVLTVSEVSLKQ